MKSDNREYKNNFFMVNGLVVLKIQFIIYKFLIIYYIIFLESLFFFRYL